MSDMLVNLLQLPSSTPFEKVLSDKGISIFRPLAPDKHRVVEWVREHSNPNAASEMDVCFSHTPVSCFIATKGKEILGYACYDATAPNFFGPTRVADSSKGLGIGKVLLLRSLNAQKEAGYVYSIIGGVGPAEFYEKVVGAILIPDSTPGIYENFLGRK